MRFEWLKPFARGLLNTTGGRRLLAYGIRLHPSILMQVLRTESGQQVLLEGIQRDPYPVMQVLAPMLRGTSSHFVTARICSETISGFEDVVWLFTSTYLTRGLIAMDLDEAAYLYRLARSLRAARCLEIGRYRGGSTFLLAAGLDADSRLVSVDKHVKLETVSEGSQLDAQLVEALRRFGLRDRVELLVADSLDIPAVPKTFDLVFIDGDHSYRGVSDDYRHWKTAVKLGGHLLFHDAGCERPYATCDAAGPGRLVKEMEQGDPAFRKVTEIASLVHFRKVCPSKEETI